MKNLYYAIMALILFLMWIPFAILTLGVTVLHRISWDISGWFINTAIWMRGQVEIHKVHREIEQEDEERRRHND